MKNQGTEELQKTQSDTYLELSKEQLIVALKEKSKEIRILQSKNSKLESKYIDVFRQHKNYKKDHCSFINVIKVIFQDFQQQPIGSYDSQFLLGLWRNKQESTNQKIKQLFESNTFQKKQIQQKLQNQFTQKLLLTNTQTKSHINSLLVQIQSLKKNFKVTVEQLNESDKKVENLNNQISKIVKQKLKLEHQINQMKMKEFSAQLNGNNEIKNQQNNQNRNEFLALRQQVQSLLNYRDQAKKEMKNLRNLLKIKEQESNQKDQQIMQLKEQKNYSKKQSYSNQQNGQQQRNNEIITEIRNQEKKKQRRNSQTSQNKADQDYIHREYLKNIFLRYFKSCNEGDDSRSKILLKIIVTILKFTNNELNMIEKSSKPWWSIN